jgi:hypothetical protein
MPIPSFDRFGLLPDGVHSCTLEEVESVLSWSDKRRLLTHQLRDFISAELSPTFLALPPLVLGGSYVTAEDNPADINLVLELQHLSDHEKMQGLLLCHRVPAIFRRYRIEMTPALQRSGNDFVTYYQHLNPRKALAMNLFHGHKKGLLRLH